MIYRWLKALLTHTSPLLLISMHLIGLPLFRLFVFAFSVCTGSLPRAFLSVLLFLLFFRLLRCLLLGLLRCLLLSLLSCLLFLRLLRCLLLSLLRCLLLLLGLILY